MKDIVEIVGYVLLATVLFGLVIGFFLIRGIIYKPRPVAPLPRRKEPPNEAAKAARAALEQARSRQSQSAGTERVELEREVRRLENRISKLEEQVYEDRREFQYAVKRRETAWLRWKELYDRVAYQGRRLEPEIRALLSEAEQAFRGLDKEVEEEWHKMVARDLMALEELRGQDVLTQAPDTAGRMAEDTAQMPETPGQAPLASGEPSPEADATEPAAAPVEPDATPAGDTQAPSGPGLRQGGLRQGGLRQGGLSRAELLDPDLPKTGLPYLEPTFDLSEVTDGVLRGANLSGVIFRGTRLRGLHLHQNGLFVGASLAGIELEPQQKPHQFVRCDFSGADFSRSRLNHAIFSGCNFSGTFWAGAQLERVKFVSCTMEGVAWQGVDLSRTVMSAEMAATLDFSGAGAPPHNAPPEAPSTPVAPASGDSAARAALAAAQNTVETNPETNPETSLETSAENTVEAPAEPLVETPSTPGAGDSPGDGRPEPKVGAAPPDLTEGEG